MFIRTFYIRFKKFSQIILNREYINAFIKGAAAGVEHCAILKSINCDCIVDIGANRGQFALAARKQFPHARIISFEPLSEPAAIFRRVFKSDSRTSLYQIAIGSAEKKLPMHVSCSDDSSSLLPISDLQKGLFPGTEEQEIRSIDVKPLGAVLRAQDILTPALMKIDVQGFELEVLKGCLSLLSAFKYIYVECSFMELYTGQALAYEVINFLKKARFNLSGVYNLSYNRQGAAVQGDFLFEKRGSPN